MRLSLALAVMALAACQSETGSTCIQAWAASWQAAGYDIPGEAQPDLTPAQAYQKVLDYNSANAADGL